MQTVNCPNNDDGICTIPSKTAVVRDDEYSIVKSASETWDADLTAASLLPINLPKGWVSRLREPQVERAIRRAAKRAGASRAVVVTCSCGHTFIADV